MVSVVDIGLPEDVDASAAVLDLTDLAQDAAASDAHKYRRGVVGVRAGSAQYPGAALLCVAGARASGVGVAVASESAAVQAPTCS